MIGKDIQKAAELLKSGKIVAIPTETVYGLAGNALDEKAVITIFAVKNRPYFDPLIIHVPDFACIIKYTKNIPESLKTLAAHFMPGPLTLLLEKNEIIPELVTAGSTLVAIRIPSHPVTFALLNMLDFPLAAPSANPFGYISPTTAQHVEDQLGDKIPYILDGGSCDVGLESTIVGIEDGMVTVYRKGGLEVEAIEKVLLQPVRIKTHSSSSPLTPGMLTVHYAPRTPLLVCRTKEEWASLKGEENVCLLRFQSSLPDFPDDKQRILSPAGNLQEAARNLFKFLRELDGMSCTKIYAEGLPESGLGLAMNDRLRRAAAQ